MLNMIGKKETTFLQHLLDGLDLTTLDKQKGSTEDWLKQKLRYGDPAPWLKSAWKEIKRLGLDHPPPLEILDMGMGPGYFLYACKKLGHRCLGLDRPGFFPFWQSLRQLLGVTEIVEHTITPRKLLPANIGRFDLVTAFRAQFNYDSIERRLWTLDEWVFFLDDLSSNVLKPRGRLVLKLTKQEAKGRGGFTRDDVRLLNFLAKRGARADKRVLIFDPLR